MHEPFYISTFWLSSWFFGFFIDFFYFFVKFLFDFLLDFFHDFLTFFMTFSKCVRDFFNFKFSPQIERRYRMKYALYWIYHNPWFPTLIQYYWITNETIHFKHQCQKVDMIDMLFFFFLSPVFFMLYVIIIFCFNR